MSYEVLISSLDQETNERIRRLWTETEAEARRIRVDAMKKAGEIHQGMSGRDRLSADQQGQDILRDAARQARTIMLSAEHQVSERLYSLARSLLSDFRDSRYEETFRLLALELPDVPWKTVRLRGDDRDMAGHFIKAGEVVDNDSMTGGFEVESEDGRLRVTNTFEKRLERVWDRLLPLIIAELRKAL